ncbi:MAG: hypothetical protein PHN64_05635 [Desulfovibrionaceae bacterium]|nr:hypothetical protein [Desulfovibrionaceae bacterium]
MKLFLTVYRHSAVCRAKAALCLMCAVLCAAPVWAAQPVPDVLLPLVGASNSQQGGAAFPVDGNVREVWTGSAYSSTFRLGLCFKPDASLSGVAYVQRADGEIDTYHLAGRKQGKKVAAHHQSGHTFTFTLVGNDAVEGVIAIKGGLSLAVKGKRWRNAGVPEKDMCF